MPVAQPVSISLFERATQFSRVVGIEATRRPLHADAKIIMSCDFLDEKADQRK